MDKRVMSSSSWKGPFGVCRAAPRLPNSPLLILLSASHENLEQPSSEPVASNAHEAFHTRTRFCHEVSTVASTVAEGLG
jgi:hypothetical protein